MLDARERQGPAAIRGQGARGRPNVLIVLIDDMGFGQSSAFGGPIHMPTVDRLAKGGLRYNQFHTTALCSPTRAALLTGRNHHVCNMGSITETATAFPGQTGQRPEQRRAAGRDAAANGYSTAAFGKSHETAAWEVSPSGPTDRWPTRSGFDKFYGFIGGEANQWAPAIYDGMTRDRAAERSELSLHDRHDQPGDQVDASPRNRSRRTSRSSSTSPRAPRTRRIMCPRSGSPSTRASSTRAGTSSAKKRWRDRSSSASCRRGTKLAPKPEAIKDWDKLSADEKKLFAHQMEVFAGFGEYADYEIGRLIQAIEDLGQLDNTLIFYIVGDNGASAEGGMNGLFNEMTYFNGVPETVEEILKHYDDLGGPTSYRHYAAGWAVAGDTPFTLDEAGRRQLRRHPQRHGRLTGPRIKAKGEVRSQWHHVIDIAPTILEAAGLPEPKSVNGTPRRRSKA